MKILRQLILGALLVNFISCGDKTPQMEEVDPAYTAYVQAFTSGMVSNRDVIIIRLTSSVSGGKYELNQPIEDDLFDFSPGIDGTAYLIDDQTIEFRPDEMLPSDQFYKVDFELSEVMEVPEEYETFTFSFQVIKQAVFISFTGMKPYDDEDLTLQKVEGTIQTADYADAEVFESIYEATQEGDDRSLSWTHSEDGRSHSFVIDSVDRKEERSEVMLAWDGDDLDIDEGEESFSIPPLGEFSVMNIHVVQEPNQRIEVHFSDPLKKDQNLEGLIYLTSNQEIRTVIESNVVYVYPKRKLVGENTVVIEEYIVNSLGYQLMEGKRLALSFTSHKPAVELVGKGVIVPNSNGVILPFKAVNLSSVDYRIVKIYENNITQFLQDNQLDGNEMLRRVGRLVKKGSMNLTSKTSINYSNWNTFYLDISDYVKTDPGAIYRVSLSFRPSQSLYSCDPKVKDTEASTSDLVDPEFAQYDKPVGRYYYYDDYYYEYNSDYNWSERENPCHISYYLRGNTVVSRNILSSDLGIIAKSGGDGVLHAFVTDLKTSEPISGVNVELYNYQQQLITSGGTDGGGMAVLNLEDQVPFLMIAKLDDQRGYLRLDDASSRSVSMFNVGGKKVNQGLKGFIYGERGVWRPGDSIFLSFILEDKFKAVPTGHPVVMKLYTPENKLYRTKIQTSSVNGFYDFRTKTDMEAPTGNWTAKVKIGGSEFTKRVRIEAIKPNRLKIQLDFGDDLLVKSQTINGHLNSRWLHGAKAGNLKADINMTIRKTKTTFKDFPDFYFDDPSVDFDADEELVYDGVVNADGDAHFSPRINVDEAPGMLNARFVTRVFEKGGDFSIDRYDIKYSPFKSYVGVKVPEGQGWNGAIYSDENNLIPIITVDQYGKPVSRQNLQVEVYKVRWRWWWEREDRYDLAYYVANSSQNLVHRGTVNTTNGQGKYNMNFNSNYWGRHFIKVTDPVSGHSTGQIFYLDYRGYWSDPGAEKPGGAEMLSFKTDKKEYGVDEDVTVSIPDFNEGRALITIENASEVLNKFWVEASDAADGFTFKTTPSMSPNVYVNVTLIQPHNKTGNNLPIRMYGIEKIMVVDQSTVLEPQITMSKELAPEKKVNIKITEKEGRSMTYTVAMVDEGLLDLTRFKTPDPWSDFYSLLALGVRTWDLYPYVLSDFGIDPNSLLAIGGDEALNNDDKKKANRFKPVVKFIGPFELDANSENEHEFVMPNYIGSVRTMVVAGENGAYGSSDFTSKVVKPVMILPTIPRVIGPGERFSVPVSVFAMDESVREVKVEIKANNKFVVKGSKTQSVRFSEVGEKMVYFDVQAVEEIGLGTFDFKATGGSHTSTAQVEIDVRAANPAITELIDGNMEAGASWSQSVQVTGIKGTEKATLELTSLPPMGLEKHMAYLLKYPYGCIEQTTSRCFAQLYLPGLVELEGGQREIIQDNIEAGINKIISFQTASGGLSYWSGESYPSEWATNYAGHFMLEAKDMGYAIPNSFFQSWTRFQKQMANSWGRKITTLENRYHDLTQAYRLYTLAKAGKPALGAMNRLMKLPNLNKQAAWRLAGAYALIGKDDVAKKIIEDQDYIVEDYRELSYSFGSRNRDLAMILETMVDLKDPLARDLMMDLAKNMSEARWLSTHETAYMLLAISKAAGASEEGSKSVKASFTVNGKKYMADQNKPFYQLDLGAKSGETINIKVDNQGDKLLFARVVLEGVPLSGTETEQSRNLSMTTRFLDMSGKEINPSIIEQGSDFMVEVRITNPGQRSHYREMVLDQIFPSGWEIRNTRMDRTDDAPTNKNIRYQDIRDDRVYTFFDLNRHESKTFRILLNATYAGKYYLPAFKSGAMYDESINANTKGQWVEVVNSSVQ